MHAILEQVINDTKNDRIKWSEQDHLTYLGIHERYSVRWQEGMYASHWDLTISISGKNAKTFSIREANDLTQAILASRRYGSDLVLLGMMKGEL